MISADSTHIKDTTLGRLSTPLLWIFACMTLAGILTFIYGFNGENGTRIWRIFLVNYVYWTGISFGTLLFSAVLNITNARWGRSLKRLAEAPGAFTPVAFVLFWVLYLGKERIFPWIREPVPEKAAWLNTSFMFIRDGAGIFLLMLFGVAIIYHSVRCDIKYISSKGSPDSSAPKDLIAQCAGHFDIQKKLSPVYGILYALVLSLISFDLLMSLDPHWYSSLFGAYFFIGSFYTGLAVIMILAILGVRYMGQEKSIIPSRLHSLGKLMLGFCLMTGDFFYTQFFVIWYGNLPEETRFLLLRLQKSPWGHIAWIVLIVAFAVPFAVLLNRRIKMMHIPMLLLSLIILAGMLIEKFLAQF